MPHQGICVLLNAKKPTLHYKLWFLLNDPQLIEAARALAIKAMANVGTGPAEQIPYIFQSATSRMPNNEERSVLNDFYQAQFNKITAGEITADEYLSIGKYETGKELPLEELTALALTAQTIMNLDETISRG